MSPVLALSIPPRREEESDSPEGSRPTSALSAPTEYGQSYNYRRIPRPRNPVSGWHTRNLSNILPSDVDGAGARIPETHRRMLSNQQTWPWLARETRSQIFPDASNSTPAASRELSVLTDVNNNPSSSSNPGRRHRQWPWQVRSQRSSIFVGSPTTSQHGQEASNSPEVDGSRQRANRSESRSKWPWQERAMKSMIFEVLTSPPEKAIRSKGRTYQWDQRQSTSVEAAVHQQQNSGNNKENKKRAQWPWQERAKQSEVFRSPPVTKGPRQPKYVWDQRKTRFSVKLDMDENFPQGSHYTDNYVTWKTVQDSTKPAGKPCYTDDEVEMSQVNRNGGESSKSERRRKVRIQDGELTKEGGKDSTEKESKRTVKGSSCMEIVPMGYRFSKDNVGSAPKEKEGRAHFIS